MSRFVGFGLRFNHKGRHYLKAVNGEDIALSPPIDAAMSNGHPDYKHLIQIADETLYIVERRDESRIELCKAGLQMRQYAEAIVKLTDADNATNDVFFPALE